MKTGILTIGETQCVRPFDERPAEVPNQLWSEIVSPPSTQTDSAAMRLADVSRQEEKRRQLLNILKRTTSPWNPSDHPELDAEHGAAGWVKKLRSEWEKRFQKRTRAKEQG